MIGLNGDLECQQADVAADSGGRREIGTFLGWEGRPAFSVTAALPKFITPELPDVERRVLANFLAGPRAC